jgi:ABC-type sugar transport system ATPase subunit
LCETLLSSRTGLPRNSYTRPGNVFVARFIGSPAMNLVPAGLIEGAGSSGMLAGFRPEHVEPANGSVDGAHFDALIEVVEYLGDEQLVHSRLNKTPLLAKLGIDQRVATGEQARFTIPRGKLHLFDAETEQAIAA